MLKSLVKIAAAAAVLAASPALAHVGAQVGTVDPDTAYPDQAWPSAADDDASPSTETWDQEPATSEWTPAPQTAEPYAQPADSYGADSYGTGADLSSAPGDPAVDADPYASPVETYAAPAEPYAPPAAAPGSTVPSEDVFTAAEDLFGRGAEGLGGILENILREQGEPTAYISGQEAGGAFVLGVRYGSGTMRHQIEGDRAVYWTGPSLGFDFGADASKVFVLVYNLHDSQDLFRRFPGAEGNAYFVGGFTAQYLRRGDVVLIPIRLGVGLRLGVNAGYMRFSERNRWLPF